MKYQALFPYKVKNKKIKCHLLQFLLGALRFILLINIKLRILKK